MHRTIPALALALTLPLGLAGCGDRSDGAASSTSSDGAASSTSTAAPRAGAPTTKDPMPTKSSMPDPASTEPEKIYLFEPNGGFASPWDENGAKAGVITSAAQVKDVIAAVPEKDRAAATQALTKAAADAAPSTEKPWYVFDGTGCQFALRLEMAGGNPKPVMDPPGPQQEQCLAAEWRMAVYRYDAAQQTVAPPAFTAPKA